MIEIKQELFELISLTSFTIVTSIDDAILSQTLLRILASQKRSR